MANRISFVVDGRGEFPLGMLRYDECWPSGPYDVAALTELDLRRRIRLESNHFMPSKGRWASFGWTVIEVNGEHLL